MYKNRKNLSTAVELPPLNPPDSPSNASGFWPVIKLLPAELLGDGIITEQILYSVAPWAALYTVQDGIQLIANKSLSENGDFYTVVLGGLIAKGRTDLLAWLDKNNKKDFVAILKDRNGNSVIVGSKAYPLRLDTNTNAIERITGRNYSDFTLSNTTTKYIEMSGYEMFSAVDYLPTAEVLLANELAQPTRQVPLCNYLPVTITAAGQTSFSPDDEFNEMACVVGVIVNGIRYYQGVHFSRTGTAFVWTNTDFVLEPDDEIFVETVNYLPTIFTHELCTVTGLNTISFAGNASNLYGLAINDVEYFSEYFGVDGSTINFTGPFDVDPTDVVIARYFNSSLFSVGRTRFRAITGQNSYSYPNDAVAIVDIFVNFVNAVTGFIYNKELHIVEFVGDYPLNQNDVIEIVFLTQNDTQKND